jgi:hypothetical protein
MPLSARLTKLNILVVGVAQSANGRSALLADHPHFSARQNNSDPIALFGHYSGRAAGTSNHLSALACRHFNIMNFKAGRDTLKRHSITRFGLTRGAAFHLVAHLYAVRTQNISLFPISIMQQGYKAVPVRVIFDAGHSCRHSVFVTLEIDTTVYRLRAAASEAAGGNAVMVPTAVLNESQTKRPFGPVGRQLGVIVYRRIATPGACRFVKSNTHRSPPVFNFPV